MVTAEELSYPAVALAPRGVMYAVETSAELQRCSAVALKRRYFSKVEVIDSTGTRFRVAAVENPRIVKGGILRLIGNPIYQVQLHLEPGAILSVEEVRTKLRKVVASHPETWQSIEEDEEITDRLGSASTLPDLYRLFAGRA